SVLASLSAGTQSSVPAWVRARAVAMNLVAVQGSLALGSVVWGWVATLAGTRVTLAISAGIMVALVLLNRYSRIALGSESGVTTRISRLIGVVPQRSGMESPELKNKISNEVQE